MQTRDRSRIDLREICRSARDVTAHIVVVALLHVRRIHHAPRDDAIAKARRESLDLILDSLRHVDAGTMRYMRIRPERVSPGRRTHVVEAARLHHEHVWPFLDPPLPRRTLARRDLLHRAAEMKRSCLAAFGRGPRHRLAQ